MQVPVLRRQVGVIAGGEFFHQLEAIALVIVDQLLVFRPGIDADPGSLVCAGMALRPAQDLFKPPRTPEAVIDRHPVEVQGITPFSASPDARIGIADAEYRGNGSLASDLVKQAFRTILFNEGGIDRFPADKTPALLVGDRLLVNVEDGRQILRCRRFDPIVSG